MLFTIFVANITFAQKEQKWWLEVNISSFKGHIKISEGVFGGPSYKGQLGYLAGIGIVRNISDRFDIESGIEFMRSTLISRAQMSQIETEKKYDLLSVPLNLRIKIIKGFFVTGGVQYDKQINYELTPSSIPDQTGIGINLKIGKDFKLNDKMIISVAPEYHIHDIFQPDYNINRRLTEFGVRVSYKLGL